MSNALFLWTVSKQPYEINCILNGNTNYLNVKHLILSLKRGIFVILIRSGFLSINLEKIVVGHRFLADSFPRSRSTL